ncbi:hypothetical protein GCM10027294_12580 [Marinactinospora endophytica]
MPAEAVGDGDDEGLGQGEHAARGHLHVGAGHRERAHHHGVLIGLANSAPVREGRYRDCPAIDTHAPYLLFHRQYLPNSPKRRLCRTVARRVDHVTVSGDGRPRLKPAYIMAEIATMRSSYPAPASRRSASGHP